MTLWDTHCHLADSRFDVDRAEVAARAVSAGVEVAVVIGADPEGWERAARLASAGSPRPGGTKPSSGDGSRAAAGALQLLFAYGLHPHEARLASPVLWADLKDRLRGASAVALGEIGLDYHYDFSPRARQREAFERQLTLAAERGLPVILHEREAAADLLSVLRTVGLPPRGGVWHCFSGDAALAHQALDVGLHLGFGGLMTFGRGTETVRQAAVACPADRLLLETDAPYLAPAPHRGRRNEPSFISDVLEFLSRLRGQSPEDLAVETTRNAAILFTPEGAVVATPAAPIERVAHDEH